MWRLAGIYLKSNVHERAHNGLTKTIDGLVFRGRNLPLNLPSATASLYLILHVAGRRIKTRKISDPGMLWNESFRL